MRDLYEQLLTIDADTSEKAFSVMEKIVYGLCQDKYEGVGYYFIILKNESLKIFPFLMLNKKCELQEPFEDASGKLYRFLKVNRIHSIFFKKEVDLQALADFLRGDKPRPANVLTNVYSYDFEQAEKIFDIVLSILLYPPEQLNQMMRIITEYHQTQDPNIKATLQKMRGDWIVLHNQLNLYLENLLSRYTQITFVIRYPLSRNRYDEVEPEGFHVFFEKAELDLEYGELRKSEFFHKPFYINKGERRDRLDSLVLKRGIEVDDLFSFIYKIYGKNKLLFSVKSEYQPYLDQKQIPPQLQAKFGNHPIPENATIEIVEPEQKWNIRDDTKVIKYIIERVENNLYVYQTVDEIPHMKLNPIKIGVLDIEDEFADFIVIHKKNEQLKKLVLRIKQHDNQLQEIVQRLKEKNLQLQKDVEEERARKGGYEEIQRLQEEIIELKKEQSLEHQTRNEMIKKITQGDITSIDSESLEQMAKDLDMSSTDVLKLLSPDILEQILRSQIQMQSDSGMESLLIASQRITPFIEKGIRDGYFSFKQVQDFFSSTLDPLSKKEVARDFAKQLTQLTPLPIIKGYEFTAIADYSPYPGGDICLSYPYNGNIAFLIVDLEGNGLEQSCNIFLIKILFERILDENDDLKANQILEKLQEKVAEIRAENPMFHCFAGLVGILDYTQHKFEYTRAALPYVYLYNRSLNHGHFLKDLGTPRIGMTLDKKHYKNILETIELKQGDILFIQTNGFSDCLGGSDKFQSTIDFLPEGNLKTFLESKLQDAQGGHPLEDDVYLLAMEQIHD